MKMKDEYMANVRNKLNIYTDQKSYYDLNAEDNIQNCDVDVKMMIWVRMRD